MSAASNIILACGGTGGHMMPAEAVADRLIEGGHKVTLVTDRRGEAIGNVFQNVNRLVLDASSHMDGGPIRKVRSLMSLLSSTLKVRRFFKHNRPTAVIGFGGYPSLPAVLAARSMNIPYILHEQNAVLGRVNRFMAKGSQLVALSVDPTAGVPQGVRTLVTGNPVRTLISSLANIAYAVPMGGGDIRIFVVGGSQGARILSDVVPQAIGALAADYRGRLEVTHQARPEDVERVIQAYKDAGVRAVVKSYFDDVAGLLLKAQLVVSRAGASTLAELAAMGRPAILVPLAIAADNHQMANAALVQDIGGGWVMEEKDFTAQALSILFHKLFDDMANLRNASDQMRSLARLDAADALADEVTKIDGAFVEAPGEAA